MKTTIRGARVKAHRTGQAKPIRFIEGLSESAWKSLVVKSLRIGWVTGLEAAAQRLSRSMVESLLLCGIFEDVFPTPEELEEVLAEIRRRDFEALCARQTHHARGYTEEFCALEPQAVDAALNRRSEVWEDGRRFRLWLPPRSLNCFWTWRQIMPDDQGERRSVDRSPWVGMPLAMLDGHTYEGKRLRTRVTVLSGHYHNHLALSQRVAAEGWDQIRAEVHAEVYEVEPPEQASLF